MIEDIVDDERDEVTCSSRLRHPDSCGTQRAQWSHPLLQRFERGRLTPYSRATPALTVSATQQVSASRGTGLPRGKRERRNEIAIAGTPVHRLGGAQRSRDDALLLCAPHL